MADDRNPEFTDEKAFSAIYEQHFRAIYRFGYRLLGNAEQAKDLAQDVFQRLFLSLDGRLPAPAAKAWIYKTATNLGYDRLRQRGRFKKISEMGFHFPGQQPDIEREFERAEEIKTVREALEALPPRDRILLLLYQDGLSYKEIADSAGVRRSSVGTLISRAIQKLAIRMKAGESQ